MQTSNATHVRCRDAWSYRVNPIKSIGHRECWCFKRLRKVCKHVDEAGGQRWLSMLLSLTWRRLTRVSRGRTDDLFPARGILDESAAYAPRQMALLRQLKLPKEVQAIQESESHRVACRPCPPKSLAPNRSRSCWPKTGFFESGLGSALTR